MLYRYTMTVPSQSHWHVMRPRMTLGQYCHISLKMVPKNPLVLHRGHFYQLKNTILNKTRKLLQLFWNQEISRLSARPSLYYTYLFRSSATPVPFWCIQANTAYGVWPIKTMGFNIRGL